MTLLEFMGQHAILHGHHDLAAGLDTGGYREGAGREEMKRLILRSWGWLSCLASRSRLLEDSTADVPARCWSTVE
jgi:hypothetical protein